jgi:hypothetical protein
MAVSLSTTRRQALVLLVQPVAVAANARLASGRVVKMSCAAYRGKDHARVVPVLQCHKSRELRRNEGTAVARGRPPAKGVAEGGRQLLGSHLSMLFPFLGGADGDGRVELPHLASELIRRVFEPGPRSS